MRIPHLAGTVALVAIVIVGLARPAAARDWNGFGDADGATATPPVVAPPAPLPRCLDFGCQQRRAMDYATASKSEGGALALELLFPGGGSVYAQDGAGAALTWGGTALGLALVIYGVSGVHLLPDGGPDPASTTSGDRGDARLKGTALSLGLLVAVASRIYGIANAPAAANRYNMRLAGRLGLEPGLTVVNAREGRDISWVPNVNGRF